MKLDVFQEAACQADHNVVVAAGAGSGKTAILSERYVRLVKERRLPVRSILTLTFTRKAAMEMLDRIYRRLQEEHLQGPDGFLAEQLEHFHEARIATLDSFCATIVRSGCTTYGISPSFMVEPLALEDLARHCALECLMEHRDNRAVRTLVALASFDRVVEDFFVNLAIEHVSLIPQKTFTGALEGLLQDAERQYQRKQDEGEEILKRFVALGETYEVPQNYQEPLRMLERWAGEYERTGKLPAEFLRWAKETGMPKGRLTRPFLVEWKELLTQLREVKEKLAQVEIFVIYKEVYQALGIVLDDFAQRFNRERRQRALLSFRDLSELALDILKNDRALRQFYKEEIRAIMIDEFQDTNGLQRDLLFLLAEKRDRLCDGIPLPEDLEENKLFFVGDEKQSIYRFRGADVTVFNSLAQDLSRANPPGLPPVLHIQNNYRSAKELLAFFNALFRRVFPSPPEGVPPYEATYRFDALYPFSEERGHDREIPSDPAVRPKGPPQQTKRVEIYLAEEDTPQVKDLKTGNESEALCIAQRILKGVREGEFHFGDVALLFRTTTHQGVFEQIFQRIGIPYRAIDPRGVFTEGPVHDMYALFRLALAPRDTNAYGTVLRSPLVGLGDLVTSRILYDATRPGGASFPFPPDPPSHWWSDGAAEKNSREERRRYELGRQLYEFIQEKIDKVGLAALMASLWYEWGYRTYLLQHPRGSHLVDQFEYLYHLALDADRRGLSAAAFVDELAPRIGSKERLTGIDGEGEKAQNEVSFLTIHKSKGLQFPVVIIPLCGSSLKGERMDSLYYWHPEWGPIVVLEDPAKKKEEKVRSYYFEITKEEEAKKAFAEFKRLLYVAATRAEQRLIFAGRRRGLKKQEDSDSREGPPEKGAPSTHEPSEESLRRIFQAPLPNDDKKEKTFFDLLASAFGAENGMDPALYSLAPLPLLDKKALEEGIEAARKQRLSLVENRPSFQKDVQGDATVTLAGRSAVLQENPSMRGKGAEQEEPPGEGTKYGESVILEPPLAFPWWTSPTAMEVVWQGEKRFVLHIGAQDGGQSQGDRKEAASSLSFSREPILPAPTKELAPPANGSAAAKTEPSHAGYIMEAKEESLETTFGTLSHSILAYVFPRLRGLANQDPEGRAPFANEKSPTKREGGQSLQGELFDETLETWRRQFSVGELMEVLPSSVRRSFSRLGVPQKKQETLVTEALEQALRFSQSPYGREVLRSSNYCFEFPFLFHLPLSPSEEKGPFQSILVRGSMDLIYETEEGCSIIDFKTDKEILPELHRVQLECYRLGAPAFSDKPVRCFLYYLRHHEIREMTDPLAPEVLFKLAQETLKKTGSMGLMEEPLVFMSEGEGGF